MLHRFAKFVAGCTVLLLLAGSLVTSTDSGLSVPDWPTTYGWNMFTFPPSKWVGGILYEHGHRLIASSRRLPHHYSRGLALAGRAARWVRWLGLRALGAVIAQGVLGGLTVLFFLPAPISTAHAGLAEIFFCLTVTICARHVARLDCAAMVAGPGRRRRAGRRSCCAASRPPRPSSSTRKSSSAPRCATPEPGSPFRISR